jgi:hypothetical protein
LSNGVVVLGRYEPDPSKLRWITTHALMPFASQILEFPESSQLVRLDLGLLGTPYIWAEGNPGPVQVKRHIHTVLDYLQVPFNDAEQTSALSSPQPQYLGAVIRAGQATHYYLGAIVE